MDGMTHFERVQNKAIQALDPGFGVDPTFFDVIPELGADGTVFIELLGEITLTGMNALLLAQKDPEVNPTGRLSDLLRARRKQGDLNVINYLASFVDDQDIDILFPIIELGGAPQDVIGTRISHRDRLLVDMQNLLRFKDASSLEAEGVTMQDALASIQRCTLYATPALHELQRKLSQRAVDEAW